jgi:hypothetical protein
MATATSLSRTVKIKGKRHYIVGDRKPLPSVTTILSAMTDTSGLDAWRKRVGDEKADAIGKFSANRGSVMHQMIEYFLQSMKPTRELRLKEAQKKIALFVEREGMTEQEYEVGRKLFFNFYNARTFDVIKDIVSIEETLVCLKAGGYAGRVDTIYRNHTGGIIISDYKSSNYPKKLEWIDKYFLQAAAYYIAYWEMTGVKPTDCEIWFSIESQDEPQIYTMGPEKIKKYGHQFLKYVKKFHELNP